MGENFSNMVQQALANLSSKVSLTEFGASLAMPHANYEQYAPIRRDWHGDVNCLRGLHDALLAFKRQGKAVRGAFHWHGWHNGDSYDFWNRGNANGAAKVHQMLADLAAPLVRAD